MFELHDIRSKLPNLIQIFAELSKLILLTGTTIVQKNWIC